MTRIFLPLAIVAALFFGPLFSETTSGTATGERVSTVSGEYFIGNTLGCLRQLKAPIGEECASDGVLNDKKTTGTVISWSAVLALAAAVVGVVGLLPFVGRLTSIVTVIAGLAAMGGMGLLALDMMATEEGLPGLQWGAYLTAGAGLLTTISGLAGMRGR